jgi:hypothetical protein
MEKCSLIRIFLGGHVGSHSQYEVFTLIYYRLGASSSDVDLIVVSDEIFIDTQIIFCVITLVDPKHIDFKIFHYISTFTPLIILHNALNYLQWT